MSGQVSDLNLQLVQEQRLRLSLEERLRSMESQLATATAATSANAVTLNPLPIARIPVRYGDWYCKIPRRAHTFQCIYVTCYYKYI